MRQLEGKVALVTGSTGGIGEATPRRFLQEGARVMAVGRSAEKLAALAARVDGGDAHATCVADATDEAGTRASVAATLDACGGLGALFTLDGAYTAA